MDVIRAGRSLLIRDRKMGTHLWFVVTDPDAETRLVVIVVLVTERGHTEKTVRVDIGDHPFINHASNVDFGSSTSVAARSKEVGIRVALGAQRGEVLRLMVRRPLALVIGGVALGLGGTVAMGTLIARLLYGVSPTDSPTILAVTVGLVAVAALIKSRVTLPAGR